MLNIKNTYFGFTNDKKPMQAARMESTLDKLWRYDGVVLSEKEFIYKKLLEGSNPGIKENYSYYSRKLDDYTKPKTLYKIEHDNNSYNEVSKTAYLFALHVLENDLLNEEKALQFIQNEIKEKEEKERLEQERIQKDREEIEKQRQIEDDERKRQYAIKQKQWLENGKQLLNSLGFDPITEVLNNHWEEIKSIYTGEEKESFYNKMTEKLTIMLGNQNYCIHYLQSYIENEKDPEGYKYTIKSNPSMTLEKEVLFNTFKNVSVDDENRTITAKVKAIYENREYKGRSTIKQHEFYYLERDPETTLRAFKKAYGQKLSIEGIECYLRTIDNNKYSVIEAKTGLGLASVQDSKNAAIDKAKGNVQNNKNRIEQVISRQIEITGISPLFQEEAV